MPFVREEKKSYLSYLFTVFNFVKDSFLGRLVRNYLTGVYLWIVRSSWKWFVHVYSDQSEVERIIDNYPAGSHRTQLLEYSLLHSKRPDLKQLPFCPVESLNSAVQLIMKVKYVTRKRQFILSSELSLSLGQILGYNQLIREVEWARRVKYNPDSEEHQEQLQRLWELAKPQEELSGLISPQWKSLGFQGKNPATDFRGMGLLGLQQLIYFWEFKIEWCQRVFLLSMHPRIGFPFAIAGISMTSLCRDLLQSGALKNYFFNSFSQPPNFDIFHQTYCSVFTLFCETWIRSEPQSIMEFNVVRQRFHNELEGMLLSEDAVLPSPVAF